MSTSQTAAEARPPAIEGRAARAERAQQMLVTYRQGASVAEIGRQYGLSERQVYIRLNELGVVFVSKAPSDIWSLPENERRIAFARRAARGARKQLRASP